MTSIDVFPGGPSGLVAQVSDGKKAVVVKAAQKNAAEVTRRCDEQLDTPPVTSRPHDGSVD